MTCPTCGSRVTYDKCTACKHPGHEHPGALNRHCWRPTLALYQKIHRASLTCMILMNVVHHVLQSCTAAVVLPRVCAVDQSSEPANLLTYYSVCRVFLPPHTLLLRKCAEQAGAIASPSEVFSTSNTPAAQEIKNRAQAHVVYPKSSSTVDKQQVQPQYSKCHPSWLE